jgi:N-acetylglutamate synthase-like GNAT family acetyltransferase
VATLFDTAGKKFTIRPATIADAKAVRMLLPELRDVAAALVAVDGKHGLIIGAAAATRLARAQPVIGPGVAVHVIEPCRGHGIGTALVRDLEMAARRAGAAALYAARRVVDGSNEKRHWMSLGFAPCETVQEHLLPLDRFESQLAPLLDRMRERGRIPPAARIIPLFQANLPAVLQLHLDHLGGNRGELYRKLRSDGAGAFHPRYSRVLVVGEKTLGCILAHRYDRETAAVDADIVDPSLRAGWANVWLKLEATRRAMRLGIQRFQFTSFDHYSDTRSFSAKLGGAVTQTTVLMMRPFWRDDSSAHNQMPQSVTPE